MATKKKKTAGGSGTGKKATSTLNAGRTIVQIIGKWGKFQFYIKPSSIVGVKDLNISVSIETEDKKAGNNEHYISRKGYQPAEISMTGIFSAALGISDVKEKSWELVNIMRLGHKGYVYIGNDKLISPMMIGVSAKVTNIEIGPNGKMIYCEVPITMKQCEKYSGGTSGKSKKSSSKRKSTKSNGSKSGGTKKNLYYDPWTKKYVSYGGGTQVKVSTNTEAKKQSSGYTPTRFKPSKKVTPKTSLHQPAGHLMK